MLDDIKSLNVLVHLIFHHVLLLRRRFVHSLVMLNLSIEDSKESPLMLINLLDEDIISQNLGRQTLDEQDSFLLHKKDHPIQLLLLPALLQQLLM
ncbi:MAG: hypothetical protein WCJ39_04750 [bacterium]